MGSAARGLLASAWRSSTSRGVRQPGVVPNTTPISGCRPGVVSIPASYRAEVAASKANAILRLIFHRLLRPGKVLPSTPFTSAASRRRKGEGSNSEATSMALRFSVRASQKSRLVRPAGVVTPIPVMTTLDILALLDRPENQRGAIAAECKRITQHRPDTHFPGAIRHIVQVAVGILFAVIDGGRNNPALDGERGGRSFDRAGGAHGMAQHRFDRAHRRPEGGISENVLDGQRFAFVVGWSAG